MEDGSQFYLFINNINIFFELLKRASDITEAMKRNGRISKEVFPLEVCATDGRDRRCFFSRGSNRNSPPPRHYPSLELGLWLSEPPTPEDLRNPKYCMVYLNKSHRLTDFYVVRTMFHRQRKEGKILLNREQNQEGVKSTSFSQHDVRMIGDEGEVILTEIVDEAEEISMV
ncbi:hypothetical protein Ahy_A09g043263 isoform B [Arachis hypogaea]|uniref:Uncharacterized protein n=1 Tax=Arachis hypogaea TaxID=3818 RepID=A0A445BHX9_ARAHY|nr:hypothetical protein Ahy_A09g043263 isoform B [Arachis hypogaea]